MKTNKIIITLAVIVLSLVLMAALVSCNSFSMLEDDDADGTNSKTTSDTTETTTEETTAEVTTAEETTAEVTTTEETTTSEATTTEHRFDYFAADASKYISIDKSAYSEMVIKLDDVYRVFDKDIDLSINQLLIANKTVLNNGAKVTDEPIRLGDSAFIFYKGVIDGKEFEGGSNMSDANPYELSIGSGTFIDGFEEGLIGVIPSGTSIKNPVALNLKFPENYGKEELNGKDVTFYVYIVWSVQYATPEYDADFITNVLNFKTDEKDVVAAHREYLRKTLEESMEESRNAAIESYLWLTLHDKVNVIKFPKGEVEYYYESYIYELEYLMSYYSYMGYAFDTLDDFAIAYLGLEKGANWKAEIKKEAENAVIQTLLTHYIADKNGLNLTEAEYEEEIQKNIDYYKSIGQTYSREEVIELVGEDMMKEGALYDKVVGFIKDNATVIYNSGK